MVHLRTKEGSLPETTRLYIFGTKEDAEEVLARYSVGATYERPHDEDCPLTVAGKKWGNRIFDNPDTGALFLSAPDDDNYLAWKTLMEAGLHDGLTPAPKVLSFLGEDRIEDLKSIYGDNWTAVAEMEFCWYNLDQSSSAFVAAKKQYNYFVSQNDFAAGYLQRDLEILVGGHEEAFHQANEFAKRQAKRAVKGGAANALKAQERRNRFFAIAIEKATQWVWKSEKEQRRFLKEQALAHDSATDEALFQVGNKPLSDQWFDNAIAELRHSGELERSLKN